MPFLRIFVQNDKQKESKKEKQDDKVMKKKLNGAKEILKMEAIYSSLYEMCHKVEFDVEYCWYVGRNTKLSGLPIITFWDTSGIME